MRCLRCGYCCLHYDVIIVDDPSKEVSAENLKHKPSGVRCQHLRGEKSGEYSCAVHNEPWYPDTPCGQFGQVESSPEDDCRMGRYLLDKGITI